MDLREKSNNFLEYIISICIVINANTVWSQIGFKKINSIILICSLFTSTFLLLRNILKSRKVFFKVLFITMIVSIFNIGFICFNGENVSRFIFNFIIVLILFILHFVGECYEQNKKNTLLIKISQIIIILAIISLFFYVFTSILNIIPVSSQIELEWGYTRIIPSYYNLHYSIQAISIGGISIIRNTGIFTEAPMYAFNLVIALAIQMFICRTKSKKNIMILVLTILTTLSATGIVICCAMLIVYYLISKSNNKIHLSMKAIISPILVVIGLGTSIFFIQQKVNESLGSDKYTSYSTRLDDFRVGFEAWKEHKFIGQGYERYDLIRAYMSTNLRDGDMGGSSGLMMMLPQGGLYLLAVYLIPFIFSLIYSIKNRQINILIMCIIVAALFIFTCIPYTYMIIYFLAIGYLFPLRKSLNKN